MFSIKIVYCQVTMEFSSANQTDREGSQCESHGSQSSTQERRKLLKRTRSLAVISEDESRYGREIPHFRIGEPNLDLTRRPQLIPRAKLIDRNSLKDRLSKSQQHLSDSYDRFNEAKSYQSRSTCALYPPNGLNSLPDPLPYNINNNRSSRQDPDRLNILEWPEAPRRYCSVQNLDSVSGLVEIVEDNWPVEGNRSLDCIYTQVKRKRKEHRSLDSILFEDDGELEYFDVLNLLPLSNVRLEIEEADNRNNNIIRERDKDQFFDSTLSNSDTESTKEFLPSTGSNETDEEKSKIQEDEGESKKEFWIELVSPTRKEKKEFWERIGLQEVKKQERKERIQEKKSLEEENWAVDLKASENSNLSPDLKLSTDLISPQESKSSAQIQIQVKTPHDLTITLEKKLSEELKPLEAVKPSKELTLKEPKTPDEPKTLLEPKTLREPKTSQEAKISKEQKPSEILKPLQELTPFQKLRPSQTKNFKDSFTDKYRANVAIVTPCEEEKVRIEEFEDVRSIWISDREEEMSRRPQILKVVDNDLTRRCNKDYDIIKDNGSGVDKAELEKGKGSIESARYFFEQKSSQKEDLKNPPTEGRFERIVKETSNIIGKACNVVKGTLGFEATSESSDLGLGSEIGSDTRRESVDDEIHICKNKAHPKENQENVQDSLDNANDPTRKNHTNLTRSRSCVDSIECQDEPEFDHVRYKIVKSNLFGKSLFSTSKGDVTYDGLMQYLREYSFQELLLDNNVVIIEPVRAEVERKPSMNAKSKSLPTCRVSGAIQKKEPDCERVSDEKSRTCPRSSTLRKHFFYHPIQINKELNDDELPNPDTVKNVRMMFEETLRKKKNMERNSDIKVMRSSSMKDLSLNDVDICENCDEGEKIQETRSRSSSRAKDLTRLFENLEKKTSASVEAKDEPESPRSESKTRILAQSFEARSGQTSPSNSNTSNKNRINRYQQNRHHNWDAGSVSSGVSSDYPDTDPGSAPPCTSSEDEDIDCQDNDDEDDRDQSHYVSQDVLKKIRECGTSVTYYGGKVVNTSNGPLISPMITKRSRRNNRLQDYVKFRLVKSNSCDSRLELTGRVIEEKIRGNWDKNSDLRECTIAEMPSIEITTIDKQDQESEKMIEEKREPPMVIGLEPKKEDGKTFKADFKLGKVGESNSKSFSALSRWQINENGWKRNSEFGKMEFEEFEVLEDSLNGTENHT
ncbi:protein javelin isoform X2 [Belonocnema kinseyi]|uniref:protein javelin isoform X2 n=1 Tax=Belonocnema kinseyi TaxID=2817044 RepID=UPI00143DA7BF|nr:protein javelin isoform X2 [Belonocnema kinseyi]